MANTNHIKVDGLSFSWPDRPMLTAVSLTVAAGKVTGMIGENGAGKSTLISILAGKRRPDSGTFFLPQLTGILTQETTLPFTEPAQALIDEAVSELRAVEQEIGELSEVMAQESDDPTIAERFDQALSRAEASGVWDLDTRIPTVLSGLGLGDIPLSTPLGGMSGGQRRRFALAMLLLRPVDAMVLDEPTNHLDTSAIDFLVSELTEFPGPVLVASHDRFFLDSVADAVVDLDYGLSPEGGFGEALVQGTAYSGSFSDYLKQREHIRTRWQAAYNAQEQERNHLEKLAAQDESSVFHRDVAKSESRMSAKFYGDRAAKTLGNRLRSARHKLADLERTAIPQPPARLAFRGIPEARITSLGTPVAVAKSVTVQGRLAPVSFKIQPGDHLLIEGSNGAGKSTILSLLDGTLSPDHGQLILAEDITIKRLPQDDVWPDKTLPARQIYETLVPPGSPSLADLGLLPEEALDRPIGLLSHGQRRRVALGALVAAPPDVLLLDEPTNHISLALAEDLENALEDFPGTVVMATHDRWIRRRWPSRAHATVLSLESLAPGTTAGSDQAEGY